MHYLLVDCPFFLMEFQNVFKILPDLFSEHLYENLLVSNLAHFLYFFPTLDIFRHQEAYYSGREIVQYC